MFKPVYAISAKSATEADILLYGVIGDSWFGDGNPGKKFVSDFKAVEAKYDRINIHINSPGGSVWDGLPIFNAIKSSKKDTHTYIDGIAMSMGAMIALSGKTVHAAKGSLMMLHTVSGMAFGNANDMRKTAEEMDVYDEVLGQLIADKTGKTLSQVKKDWMNHEDHFMSAASAHEAKLVDVLESYEAKDMPENAATSSPEDILRFYQPQAEQLNDEAIGTLANRVHQIIKDNKKANKNMLGFNKYKSLSALKGKKASEVTAAEVLAVNEEIVAEGLEGITLVLDSALETVNNAATANTGALSAINAVLPADQQQTSLSAAVTAIIAKAKADADAAKEWKEKADAYGAQPGAMPTNAATKPEEGVQAAEGGEALPPVENKFETSVDREIAARRKALGQ